MSPDTESLALGAESWDRVPSQDIRTSGKPNLQHPDGLRWAYAYPALPLISLRGIGLGNADYALEIGLIFAIFVLYYWRGVGGEFDRLLIGEAIDKYLCTRMILFVILRDGVRSLPCE